MSIAASIPMTDEDVIKSFPRSRGASAPGVIIDFLGTRTRSSYICGIVVSSKRQGVKGFEPVRIRRVVEVLRRCDDYYPYIRGLVANCGFRRAPVPYVWKARRNGFSKNRLYHLIDQGLNGLVSFTNVPMRLCLLGGMGLSVLSIAYALFSLTYHLFFHGTQPAGTATLITGLFFLGTLGEYITAIHSQVRKRPLVIERGALTSRALPRAREPSGGAA
jgi:hypothetical protein